ncbi:MAG TPA: L-2-hydroxyglutarate oxidase [Stenomitos sp.]
MTPALEPSHSPLKPYLGGYDLAVVGAGIVGLASALALSDRYPKARLVLFEKEASWGHHQTGHNSGVIHSGIYYTPGSFKARFSAAGNRSLIDFCRTHDLPHELCGKLIVATDPDELPRLEALYERGLQNGLDVRRLSPEAAQEIEPNVHCLAALHVPSTGIVDYGAVCRKLAELLEARGVELRRGCAVLGLSETREGHVVETPQGDFAVRWVVNCAGLHSDRVARLAKVPPQASIVPFRGEYYELVPQKRHLVRHLIYPVPNPAFPFLGVHFTRMIDGRIHAGPNAVLSLKREGYRKTDFSLRDTFEIATHPGVWKLAARHYDEGLREMVRSWSKALFVRSLQKLVPEIQPDDLVPCEAGVRAQALTSDGRLVDDFLMVTGTRSLHVCNAPSPAATASLEIGRAVAERLEQTFSPGL